MSLSGIFNSHPIISAAVTRFGTEAQKREWLPKFATGEIRGGLALTEPNCGTDLQAIRMTARRDGDDYVINGTKTWISHGDRKSVVKGKRVSVRVDLGGRRIVKITTINQTSLDSYSHPLKQHNP